MCAPTEPVAPATLPGNPRRVLLLTTGHLGSNIFCTPAIHLLKQRLPDVHFDVVASSARGASAFESNPDIGVAFCRRTARGTRRLAARYDLVLGLHHDQAERFLARSGVPYLAVGPDAQAHGHRAEAILEFVHGLLACGGAEPDRHYVICPQARHRAHVDRLLARCAADDILVGLHLGTGRTANHGWKFWYAKRARDPRIWPSRAYVEVARRLRAANPRIRPVLIGVRNERFLARRFEQAVTGPIDLTGRTSLLDVAALMSRLDVLVCADSGVLHVACATDVPIVALFGPTSPTRSGPYPAGPRCIVLRGEPIVAIHPDRVAAAIMTVLAPRLAELARRHRPR
jgi:ADP-heptose:LPS heptosyltransferase